VSERSHAPIRSSISAANVFFWAVVVECADSRSAARANQFVWRPLSLSLSLSLSLPPTSQPRGLPPLHARDFASQPDEDAEITRDRGGDRAEGRRRTRRRVVALSCWHEQKSIVQYNKTLSLE
jgi:hypothetical protein